MSFDGCHFWPPVGSFCYGKNYQNNRRKNSIAICTLWLVPFILKKFIELFTNLLTFIYEWFYKTFCFTDIDLCCVWEAVISKVSLFPSGEKAHFLLTSRLPVVSLRQILEKSSVSDNSYLRRGLFFVSYSKIYWKDIQRYIENKSFCSLSTDKVNDETVF